MYFYGYGKKSIIPLMQTDTALSKHPQPDFNWKTLVNQPITNHS